MTEARGNRGSSLRLPPVWPCDGVYTVMSVNAVTKTVTIQQKWTGHCAHLNFSDKLFPVFAVESDLEVIANYSEVKAKLHSK
eukprot:5443557-Amphidinium_carterae.1